MKKTLEILILIMAIGMATTVAYVSVSGLVKLFAGAGAVGLIFFSSIEAGKIIATSAIHSFNKKIGWVYNTILSFFIIIAMAITSLGIYGFLSSSYKETFSKLEEMESKVILLDTKKEGYTKQLELINKDRESIREQVNDLNEALKNNKSQYVDRETGNLVTYSDSRNRKAIMSQLDEVRSRESQLNTKSDSLTEIIFNIESQITETKLGNDVATELGPLKYLADVTGMSMDDVMKYFIILLMVIGDPMAVVMVIVYNKITNTNKVRVKEKKVNKPKINYDELLKGIKTHLPKDFKHPFGQKEPSKEGIEEPGDLVNTEETKNLGVVSTEDINPDLVKTLTEIDEQFTKGRSVSEMTKELLEENRTLPTEEIPQKLSGDTEVITPTEEVLNTLDDTIKKAKETQDKLYPKERRVLKDDGNKRTLIYKKRGGNTGGQSSITRI